jgi:hypothetical protein
MTQQLANDSEDFAAKAAQLKQRMANKSKYTPTRVHNEAVFGQRNPIGRRNSRVSLKIE